MGKSKVSSCVATTQIKYTEKKPFDNFIKIIEGCS